MVAAAVSGGLGRAPSSCRLTSQAGGLNRARFAPTVCLDGAGGPCPARLATDARRMWRVTSVCASAAPATQVSCVPRQYAALQSHPSPLFAVCHAVLCCAHAMCCVCRTVPRVLQATLPTSDVKSSTETKASKSGSKITWGDFGRQQPWAVEELKVHFHHDKPFKRVRR